MIYEIYSSNPKKGLVSVAPHCRDTSSFVLAEQVKEKLLDNGAHVIIRRFDDTQSKQFSISYTVNSRALKKLEEQNESP